MLLLLLLFYYYYYFFFFFLGGLLWFSIFSRYWNLYKITFVNSNDVTNRANFQSVVTSTFAKKAKNNVSFSFIFAGFWFFDPPNDLKSKKWPYPPNIIWGWFYSFFVWPLLLPQKWLNIIFWPFLLSGCSKTLLNHQNFVEYCRRPFEQSLFLLCIISGTTILLDGAVQNDRNIPTCVLVVAFQRDIFLYWSLKNTDKCKKGAMLPRQDYSSIFI